jgi:hypothetical protein
MSTGNTMKTFKKFVKDKKEKEAVPSLMNMHGEHSRDPKDNVPSLMNMHGGHARKPDKKLKKEEWDTKKGEWTGDAAKQGANNWGHAHETHAAEHHDKMDDNANPHIGSYAHEVQGELETRHDMSKLNHGERASLDSYSSSSFYLNKDLHNARAEGRAPSPEHHSQIEQLDSALKRQKLPYHLTVHHGAYADIGKEAAKTSSRQVHVPSYTSTSIKPSIATRFANLHHDPQTGKSVTHVLRIHLPKGHHGIYLGTRSQFSNEHEFLMPRNTRLRIAEHPEIHPHPHDKNTQVHIWDAHPVEHNEDDHGQKSFDFNK